MMDGQDESSIGPLFQSGAIINKAHCKKSKRSISGKCYVKTGATINLIVSLTHIYIYICIQLWEHSQTCGTDRDKVMQNVTSDQGLLSLFSEYSIGDYNIQYSGSAKTESSPS